METLKPKVLLPFSNPVFIYDIPYDQNFRNSLINECIKHKDENKSINLVHSYRQIGYQSKKILFSSEEPSLQKLSNYILNSIKSANLSLAPNIEMANLNIFTEGWININQKGTLHFPHTHQGSTLSGVFYVKVPKAEKVDPKDISKPAFIEFLDPRNDVTGYAEGIKELSQTLTFRTALLVEPKEGQLIIFPSWLKHWVYPNNEESERISISFNTKLIKQI